MQELVAFACGVGQSSTELVMAARCHLFEVLSILHMRRAAHAQQISAACAPEVAFTAGLEACRTRWAQAL